LLLQHCINIAFATLSSTVALQHRFCSWVATRFTIFGGAKAGSWGLKYMGNQTIFFYG
jgi:hypothetical protein